MAEIAQDPRIATLVFEIGDRPQSVRMTEKTAIDYILTSLRGGPSADLRRAFNAMRSVKSYRRLIKCAANTQDASQEFRDRFHTAWTVEGFRWREAVEDDALALRALRAILTPYEGPGLTLFRGEQASRYDAGRLGFNWTPKRSVAEMFASGLCSSYDGGGILLMATAPTASIIASPGSHSTYLDEEEFVIEPGLLMQVTELARHPQK